MVENEPEHNSSFKESYRAGIMKKMTFIAICIIGCILVAVYSATLGPYGIGAGQVWNCIVDAVTGRDSMPTDVYHIVINLRLPRIFGALVAGFGLAICGAAMQSMLKNPLADPYTMGISSGAGFGAALAMILGFELIAGGGVVLNAFVFAIIPALVILFLSKFRNATPTMMILCGIALMYLFNAATQLFMLISDPDDLSAVYTWTVGSVAGVEYSGIVIMLIITILGSIYIQYMANQLNVMGLGDESAKTLGVDIERRRLIVLMVITLVAAVIVSFTGIIGFIGLVAPHMVRAIIGSDNRYLIPASAVFGALLLMLSDIVARVIADPVALPVGVITSCIGGPLFLFLILRNNKEVWA